MSDAGSDVDMEGAVWRSPIANPMIAGKLKSRTLRLLKKAKEAKQLRRGVPDVTKALRKGKKGMLIIAGDVSPVDVIAHMPVLAEERGVLYAFVESRKELGLACGSKRPMSVVLIHKPTTDSPFETTYGQVREGIKVVHPYMGGESKKTEEKQETEKQETEKKEKKEKKAKKEEKEE